MYRIAEEIKQNIRSIYIWT